MYALIIRCGSSLHDAFRHGWVGEHGVDDVFALGTQLVSMLATSAMLLPSMRNHCASFFSLDPPQTGQVTWFMNEPAQRAMAAEASSLFWLSMKLMMPSKLIL